MNELSRRMMVTGGNVTGITDQLEAEGLVERIDGGRATGAPGSVRLTPKLARRQFEDHGTRATRGGSSTSFAGLDVDAKSHSPAPACLAR
jgi:hypothetical protein